GSFTGRSRPGMRTGGRISITESYFMMFMKFIYYACLAVVILMAMVFCVSVFFILENA
ncbi:hypothetical protein AH95_004679, partial [Salmonella enterica subsp. enterica]|nr:hypothetical protein [Salmonella enterica subsp. enterica]EDU9498935.1 hypothetical protein [Salmonella enterica]EGW4275491.1 hypothetical protein [Salmonella enterica subsp. enterica serovar Typhimurium]ELP2136387.1 hypothetical protein [Salmonella enterica subsp. enterica serovar Copenhagen]